MKKLLTYCKSCNEIIDLKAEKCPFCGVVNRKPLVKKWWFWMIVVLFVVSIALVAFIMLYKPKPIAFSEDTAAIESADASVVTLFCYDYDGELAATGSGFIAFDSKTVVTNYHVIESAYTCKMSTNQDISYNVSNILCYSKEYDIAILQTDEDTGLQPLTLGNSQDVMKGETVVAIGSPLGIKNTVSTGVLSGRIMETNMDVLQFTAPISSGSSGGALFDDRGNIIGITFASYEAGQNLNLAIPIEIADRLYQNKTSKLSLDNLYIKNYPYVKYLDSPIEPIEVTISDLKIHPEMYDGKKIKLVAYVSSFSDNWLDDEGGIFVSNQADVSYDYEYDWSLHNSKKIAFEDEPTIYCTFYDCEWADDSIEICDEVVIIGGFIYFEEGDPLVDGGEPFFTNTYAYLNGTLIYQLP